MTKTTTHTPGPWHVKDSFVMAEHGESIADMLQLNAGGPANAKLIAAAPELLEVCKRARTNRRKNR